MHQWRQLSEWRVYLTQIKNISIRTQLSKFRLSNHTLAIEVGRHQGVQPGMRYCTFCDKVVECEIHFLINCPIYNHLRAPVFEEVISAHPTFTYLSNKEKFITIMTKSRMVQVASFIHKSFELRNFLMAKPRHHDQLSKWFFNTPVYDSIVYWCGSIV